ncbi:MAG: glycosyltransferase family 1 protein, partial [bacterium]|nr:glycosyltransferase family 1 protein [bacterium]
SAMPEVGGKAALYIDPADPESIADAMGRVAEDRKLRNDLIEASRQNIGRFSWDRCAAETLAVLIK